MVGSMNQSERIAYDWLLNEKNYSEEEITRRNAKQTPDFICPEKTFEVKRLYGNRVVAYKSQIEQFDDDTFIIVVDGEEVVKMFEWGNREESNFDVVIQENSKPSDDWTTVRISEELKTKLEKNYRGSNINEKILVALGEKNRGLLTETEVRDIVRDEIEQVRNY